ncbi:hypothetical protein HOLleu_39700 [Holothuria leucospilota]|uniref:Integral membrane protein 2 n=1 Tax=Holothuria leucospilota TaxID=206669 RepID=A0A9Q1BC90_HOLLE|nr:hypothetical protein HOLleu_39700 [Holothuria leucospilota]
MDEKLATETPVVFTVSSSSPKAKESYDGTHQLAVKVFGVVMVTGFLIGGFLGTVYFLSQNNTDGNQSSARGSEEIFHDVKEVKTQYEVKGKNVTESFYVDMDSKIVVVDDFADNFKVILDYKRNLAVFKNLTSSTCYFTNLEDVPIHNPFDEEDYPTTSPFIFMPLSDDSQQVNASKIMTMQNLLELPRDYVTKTNSEEVSGMCSSSKSFWISLEDDGALQESDRNKRTATRSCSCSFPCCVYVNGVLVGCGECTIIIIRTR